MRFSVIIRADHTNRVYFRDCIEAVVSQSFSDFELIIADENPDSALGIIVREFFPEDDRITYRHIVSGRTAGFALNYAISTAKGDILLFLNQHDRVGRDTLSTISKAFEENPGKKLIYSDFDEIENASRVRPHFLSSYNVELLRQVNYIGNSFAVRNENIFFSGKLKYFPEYDFLIRFSDRRNEVFHIERLLFHRHFLSEEDSDDYFSMYGNFSPSELSREKQKLILSRFFEAKTIIEADLLRHNISATIEQGKGFYGKRTIFSLPVLSINYSFDDYYFKKNTYTLIKDKNVRFLTRNAAKKLFGVLSQKDVVIAGPKILKNLFSIESCGFIFDKKGIAYPACYDEGSFSTGYDGRIALRQDVSAVSLSCFIVSNKFLNKSGGLDKSLSRRDMMLDLCLKAIEHGYRVVYEPGVTALASESDNESNEISNGLLLKKHGDFIEKGDPYYNENLPMGLKNYTLF